MLLPTSKIHLPLLLHIWSIGTTYHVPGLSLTSNPSTAGADLQPLGNHTLAGLLSEPPSPLAPVHHLLTES